MPARQTNRVHLGVTPARRVVIAEGVVVQARFTVQVLALEAQVLRGVPVYRCAFPQAAAPGA